VWLPRSNRSNDQWRVPKRELISAELEKLCGMQCTDEEIAAFFGVSTRTIEHRRLVPKFRVDGAGEGQRPCLGPARAV
jgi:hypothetical protein